MEKEKEIKRMVGDICNYVRRKGVTSVSVVANSPYIKYLHNTGIAEWLIEKGYGDVRAAVRKFAGVLRDKISREHSLGTKGYIVGFKEMKQRALADVDALVKEVCGDEYE